MSAYDDRPEEQRPELLVPFLCVASNGGPFDDQAFVAGVQLGGAIRSLQNKNLAVTTELVDERLEEQCDLIAMAYGFKCDVLHRTEGWIHVGFTAVSEDPL